MGSLQHHSRLPEAGGASPVLTILSDFLNFLSRTPTTLAQLKPARPAERPAGRPAAPPRPAVRAAARRGGGPPPGRRSQRWHVVVLGPFLQEVWTGSHCETLANPGQAQAAPVPESSLGTRHPNLHKAPGQSAAALAQPLLPQIWREKIHPNKQIITQCIASQTNQFLENLSSSGKTDPFN